MKALLISLLVIFANPFLYSNVEDPVTLKYNYAFSGLKLRTAPGTDSEVITIIPFGERLELLNSSINTQSIEWIEGSWIKVLFKGQEGYVFDGFISDFPVPTQEFELTSEDLDLSTALSGWVRFNFEPTSKAEVIEQTNFYQEVQAFEDNIQLTHTFNNFNTKVTTNFRNKTIGEVFNLLKAMLLTKNERIAFTNNAVFIKNKQNELSTIKVDLENPVEIKRNSADEVVVTVTSFHKYCQE